MAGPLEGIRVLDFTIAQQGPNATLVLRELGAEVIKVEQRGVGDISRLSARDRDRDVSFAFLTLNRGKKDITLDLKAEKGRRIALALGEISDVVVENYRPGVMAKLGLDYEDFRAVNPRVIYASASAFGRQGRWASKPGLDILAQAATGLAAVTGEEGDPPIPAGAALADHIGALNLALGILAALFYRERTGKGQRLDSSLVGGLLYAQAWELGYYFGTRRYHGKSGRGHVHVLTPYRIVPTADGHMAVVALRHDDWPRFCQVIGRPDLVEDPRFATLRDRVRNRKELWRVLDEHFSQRPTAEWMAVLEEADFLCAPAYDYTQVMEEPHFYEAGYLVEYPHPRLGPLTMVNFPIKFSESPAAIQGPEPEMGEHTEEVLTSLGYSPQEIEALREEGVV
jgi:crotonobetainyl-CoA:carnitine CoA-transferase CaiB-like acyl-CoA transferase